ncbi:MAG: radical SAM protein [Lachnospiraceae bacterium]|nr:radical SAM protein [Lachnospiraceae bacterium]
MSEAFDIQAYMTAGVERIVKGALRATVKNPRESAFMVRYAAASRRASKLRDREEKEGLHVPAFLIASITSSCNLHCAGCYSRANHACVDTAPQNQLTAEEWEQIFLEAQDLGVGFILLAGGEPMVRLDVIKKAGDFPDILFPIFTNGTMIGEEYLKLFDRCRNLLPVISIEGDEAATDHRRGAGVYQKLIAGMERLQEKDLIYGASITVTTDNLEDAVSEEFMEDLRDRGCKAVFFIEFVPVTEEATHLAPEEKERVFLKEHIAALREKYTDMVFVSFPGDEKTSGGCVAAGRGFFHINSHGGAEPCPFSPYSDINVRDTSLKDAIGSKLFRALQSEEVLREEHAGGCVLFERREQVEAILQRS